MVLQNFQLPCRYYDERPCADNNKASQRHPCVVLHGLQAAASLVIVPLSALLFPCLFAFWTRFPGLMGLQECHASSVQKLLPQVVSNVV